MTTTNDLAVLRNLTAQTDARTTSRETTIPRAESIVRGIRQLLAADDTIADNDGYPTKTPGAPPATGHSPNTIALDHHGNALLDAAGNIVFHDVEPTTGWSTETAAIRQLERGQATDPIHQIRLRVERNLDTVARAIEAINADLVRFDNIRSPDVPTGTEWCFVARVILKLPYDDAWAVTDPTTGAFTGKRTRFDGVIEHPFRENRPVCRWIYDFARTHRRLPTEDEALQYIATGYVRVTIDPKALTPAVAR